MNDKISSPAYDLIPDYYLRELTSDELEELQQLLENDLDARQHFVQTGRDEWLLHHVHHIGQQKITYFRPRAASRRRIQAIAAGVAVLATLGALLYSKSATITRMMSAKSAAPVIGTVTDLYVTEGDAVSVVNDGQVRKLNTSSSIREGDRVVIPPGGQLAFRYLKEETEVRLGGNSLVHVRHVDGAKHIRLNKGRLSASVARQQEDQPLRIVTGDAEAVVLGTSFELFADEATRLTVLTGKVRLNELNSGRSATVGAGHYAETAGRNLVPVSFKTIRLQPVHDQAINYSKSDEFLVVDPRRHCEGFLKFDLSGVRGLLLEATLKLRVTGYKADYGGNGDLRLFSVHPDRKGQGPREEIACFSGRAGRGKELKLDLSPSFLTSGINAFVLALDKGGDDFWFSSSEGEQAPVLELKIAQ